jgi:hypothetical protein
MSRWARRGAGFGFRVSGFGFRVEREVSGMFQLLNLKMTKEGHDDELLGAWGRLRVSGFGFRVSGFGFRVPGFELRESSGR